MACWVANQQQCGFRLMVRITAKNSVLLGVGILENPSIIATGNRVRIAAANTSPLSLRSAESSRL
ncbi:hypothetical protein ACLB1T_05120 [Escherichia coli]